MTKLDETHDSSRRSWVESANLAETDFPIQNLPLGIFHRSGERARGGVAIGDEILDLKVASEAGLFSGESAEAARAASGSTLNPLMALGNRYADALRNQLSELLRGDGPERGRLEKMQDRLLVPMTAAKMELPAHIGAFTDFLCSIYHTSRMARGGPLPPAFKHLPIAYNSRATSVRVSGEAVKRPNGQFRLPSGEPSSGAEPSLDFELELGAFVGPGNALGAPVPIDAARDQLFGFCLLNDWSARGIQIFESQPLGPFLGKSFSTSISPWIVTAAALAPFRAPAFERNPDDHAIAPYLVHAEDQQTGGVDFDLEAFLLTPKMRAAGHAPARVTQTNFRHCYWTFAQMLAHHTSNGCNLQTGDLLGSGTLSGPTDDSRACLAEITAFGTAPISLPDDENRPWLNDGDEVIFRARAKRSNYISIGFGECRARIDPAIAFPAPN